MNVRPCPLSVRPSVRRHCRQRCAAVYSRFHAVLRRREEEEEREGSCRIPRAEEELSRRRGSKTAGCGGWLAGWLASASLLLPLAVGLSCHSLQSLFLTWLIIRLEEEEEEEEEEEWAPDTPTPSCWAAARLARIT